MHKLASHDDPACRSHSCPPNRRGTMLIELTVSAVLLGTFVAGIVPVVVWVRSAQTQARQHRLAAMELANQMERIAALPAERRTVEQLQQIELSPDTARALPAAELRSAVEDSSVFPGQIQVRLTLSWMTEAQRRTKPLELYGWFPAGTSPETP